MSNISTENINTLAQLASSISDGDYFYIYKASSNSFSRIEKSLLESIMGGSGGGGATSATVIANVNTLQAKIDELIGNLANAAFSTSRPDFIGELDWGGSDVIYYGISIATSTMYTMSNAATSIIAGQTYENTITANVGYILTGVTINGVAQPYTSSQCVISIPNVSSNINIIVSAEANQVPVTTYSVGRQLTDLEISPDGGIVAQGGTFQCTFALASSVTTGKRLPNLSEITINGTHGNPTMNGNLLTIPNIQSDITIIASAITTSGVMHNVNYNLTGCIKSSGATSVDSGDTLSVVLTKDSSNWNAVTDFLARDIIVMMGGEVLQTSDSNFSISQLSANGDISITIENVNGDVEIMNVIWKYGWPVYDNPDVSTSTANRSAYNDTLIPIPDGCTELRIYNTYPGDSNRRGVRFYDANGNDVESAAIPINADGNNGTYPGEMIATWSASEASSHRFVRIGLYVSVHAYSDKYIKYKDSSNNLKYIWKGQ